VHSKRQGLHLPRLQQVVLIDRGERRQVRQGVGHPRDAGPREDGRATEPFCVAEQDVSRGG
jgi:hypothetical protein